ncbi:hypothetical protein TSUD_85810 [Trifolium subterraneum]|uniref:Uncharacterized protein n=1 Tax=Trifolium subterraneum TaxID=3900 RepID=A0A2Z6P9N6_TRISU|nr:hypothetical protein TSUD_85810 [Trifolium subterraneum]
MSSSPRMNSPTASPTFSFPAPLPLRPQLMSIYKAKVSVKLDEENFLLWRLLVEPVIKGQLVNLQEHVDVILGGLPEEYNVAVKLINNKSPSTAPYAVDKIEYILLAREVWIDEKKKVQNNNESDESDCQSLSGNIYSGQQPIPPLPSTNSFLKQYPPNAALLAAAASDSRYLPPAWTSPPTFWSYPTAQMNNMRPSNPMPPHPQPQPPQPPLPPSYASASSYSQSNY